jgi:hypothetical protein
MGAAPRSDRERFGEAARGFEDLIRQCCGNGRDALPRERDQTSAVTSGAAPLGVSAFRRVRRSTSTEAFQTGDAGRAEVQLPSEAVHRI